MNVYLVVEAEGGGIFAVMADKQEAEWFAEQLDEDARVEERKLWYGQPTNRGYNE